MRSGASLFGNSGPIAISTSSGGLGSGAATKTTEQMYGKKTRLFVPV